MLKKLWRNYQEGQRLIMVGGITAAVLVMLFSGFFWNLYVQALDLGAGGVGSKAAGDTPVAHSLAEMGTLEKFTVLEDHKKDSKPENIWLDDENYFIMTLENGERALLRYNYNNGEILSWKSEGVYVYRYPVGTWKPLEISEQARGALPQLSPPLTRTDFYIDMEGNSLTAMSETAFKGAYFTVCLVIGVFAMICYGTRRVDKWEREEQAEHEASLPRNDLELWLVGTYAIWGQFFAQVAEAGGRMAWDKALENGPLHFGGRPRDDISRRLTRETLLDSWDIKTQDELLDTVAYMSTGPGFQKCRTQADRAWQLCRSVQLLGMSYIAGWCCREEMVARSCEVGSILQKTFRSWEELCESFLEGYAQWQLRSYPQQALANIHIRRSIYEGLWRRPDSPYRLNWYLPLDPDEWSQRDERRAAVERRMDSRDIRGR